MMTKRKGLWRDIPVTADDLRAMGVDELEAYLKMLTPKQLDEISHTFEFWARPAQLEPIGKDWRYWIFNAGRGAGKDLQDSTPIFTTKGFTTIGDICVGDEVFAWDGTTTKVTEVYKPNPRELYEFTFSDGTTLVSSCEHDWLTWTHKDRKAYNRSVGCGLPTDWVNWKSVQTYGSRIPQGDVDKFVSLQKSGLSQRKAALAVGRTRLSLARASRDHKSVRDTGVGPSVKNTQSVIDTFTHGDRGDLNHSIPVASPLSGKHSKELVDGYYLGYWLGDGLSASLHSLSCGAEDKDHLLALYPDFQDKGNCVFRATAGSREWLQTAYGLRNNKHFPDSILLASKEQRLAVLRGLMDSDGYCAPNSSVEFCNTNKSIADGCLQLARTLGQKPVLSEGRATLYGKDCGPKYRVTWSPVHGIDPFALKRKSDLVTFGKAQESRNYHRMIVSYKEVPYEPTTCISVDHPDHLFLAGESLIPTHNTFAGANWVRHRVKMGNKMIACVAPTKGDVRKIMVEGDSGLLNLCWKEDKTYRGIKIGYPEWSPTNNTLTWENGAKALFYSAEDPSRLRGPNHDAAWADEVASWNNQREVWDMLKFTLRKGNGTKLMVTTTPRPTKLIRELLDHPKSHVTMGSSYDNAANLDKDYLDDLRETYEGTRLGRQEIHAEYLGEADGALWNREILDSCLKDNIGSTHEDRVEFAKTLSRVIVSIDPAISHNEESDLTGIIVAGVDVNGKGYILEDHTGTYTPQGWAAKAVHLYNEFSADRIVAEKNQGGAMVRSTLTSEDETVPIRLVHASRGKFARAEPVSALYEQGKVFHAKGLDDLETQMVTWEPLGSIGSPDRLDAMVWAITDLMLKGTARPTLKLVYGDAKGLLH